MLSSYILMYLFPCRIYSCMRILKDVDMNACSIYVIVKCMPMRCLGFSSRVQRSECIAKHVYTHTCMHFRHMYNNHTKPHWSSWWWSYSESCTISACHALCSYHCVVGSLSHTERYYTYMDMQCLCVVHSTCISWSAGGRCVWTLWKLIQCQWPMDQPQWHAPTYRGRKAALMQVTTEAMQTITQWGHLVGHGGSF